LLKILTELQDSEMLIRNAHEKALEGRERPLEDGEEPSNDLEWLKAKHEEQTAQLVQEFQQLQGFLLKQQTEELEQLYNENPSLEEDGVVPTETPTVVEPSPPPPSYEGLPKENVGEVTDKVLDELLKSDNLSDDYSQVLGTLRRLNV